MRRKRRRSEDYAYDSDDDFQEFKRAKQELEENENLVMQRVLRMAQCDDSSSDSSDNESVECDQFSNHFSDYQFDNKDISNDFSSSDELEHVQDFDEDQNLPSDDDNEYQIDSDDELYGEMISEELNSNKDRPIPLSGLEAIIVSLMTQARKNLTDVVTECLAEMSNDTKGYNHISSTNYDCMVNRVPNAFKPNQVKYFFARCGHALVGPVTNLNVPTSRCSSGHKSCIIQDPATQIKDDSSYFCYISVREWLTHLVTLWFDKLRFAHPEQLNATYYHDLCNCLRYHEIAKPYLSESNDIATLTLTLTWDGVKCSETKSLWPIAGYLNELPFQDRINNPMLFSLYATSKAPELLFDPLISELEVLESEPMIITVNNKQRKFLVKILFIIADEPGRSALLNCVGHTGLYGCHMCEINAKNKDNRFNCVCFRTPSTKLPFRKRTDSDWRTCANSLKRKKKESVKGIKGDCQIMRLKYLDIPILCPPEPMHSMYLGNVKSILSRWMGKDVDGKVWHTSLNKTLGKQNKDPLKSNCIIETKTLESRLQLIKFPEKVLRKMPKFTSTSISSLKSMEYEVLLFYGFVAFKDLIDDRRYHNFKQLAWILSRLSSRNIKKTSDLRQEEAEIDRFLKTFDSIYNKDEAFMWRINIHSMVHLCDCVRLYGPLPIQSAYYTEDLFGRLARQAKTGTHIPQQVMNKFVLQQSIAQAINKMIREPTCSSKFISKAYCLYPTVCPPVAWDPSDLVIVKKCHKDLFIPTELYRNFCSDDQRYKSVKRLSWFAKDAKKSQTLCTRSHNKKMLNQQTIVV